MEQVNTGGSANTLSLTQKGGIHSAANTIDLASQNGSGNDGTVTQIGRLNYLSSLSQTGAGNDAVVTLKGTGNGDPDPFTFVAALGVGVPQAVVTQTGNNDTLSYIAVGDYNLYGFLQITGDHNDINGTTTGDLNQVAVKHDGDSNITDFAQTGESPNDLLLSRSSAIATALARSGALPLSAASTTAVSSRTATPTRASFTIGGSDANYGAKQTGDDNILVASLTGGDNNNLGMEAGRQGQRYHHRRGRAERDGRSAAWGQDRAPTPIRCWSTSPVTGTTGRAPSAVTRPP